MILRTLLGFVLVFTFTGVQASDRGRWQEWDRAGGSEVRGWRLDGRYDSGGYAIFRRDHGRWYRVEGRGVQLAGHPDAPWLRNSQNEIYRWRGRGWQRVRGTAVDISDGWAIGTDRRPGGFGIYRFDGREFRRMPGAAVEIGGSYEHPWVINDRGEYFEWNGRDWRQRRSRRW